MPFSATDQVSHIHRAVLDEPHSRGVGVWRVTDSFICLSGGLVLQGGVSRVLAHRLDPVQSAGLALVSLAGRDDLAVAGLEAEPVLTRRVLVQLELARHRMLPCSNRP